MKKKDNKQLISIAAIGLGLWFLLKPKPAAAAIVVPPTTGGDKLISPLPIAPLLPTPIDTTPIYITPIQDQPIATQPMQDFINTVINSNQSVPVNSGGSENINTTIIDKIDTNYYNTALSDNANIGSLIKPNYN